MRARTPGLKPAPPVKENMKATKYPMPPWAVQQIVRGDRPDKCVEDICKHGVGHPNREWSKGKDDWHTVHGCDGCCYERKEAL
jgi:hypothetical protein